MLMQPTRCMRNPAHAHLMDSTNARACTSPCTHAHAHTHLMLSFPRPPQNLRAYIENVNVSVAMPDGLAGKAVVMTHLEPACADATTTASIRGGGTYKFEKSQVVVAIPAGGIDTLGEGRLGCCVSIWMHRCCNLESPRARTTSHIDTVLNGSELSKRIRANRVILHVHLQCAHPPRCRPPTSC